jgi:hypothetical protein
MTSALENRGLYDNKYTKPYSHYRRYKGYMWVAVHRMSSLSGRMNIARVNIGFFTGFKKIKQRRISFVLGYLRMIL